jgi:large subunit ribosomal protein L10
VGKTLADKQAMVTELKQELSQSQMTLVIDYKGLTVAEITDLRRRLRESGATCAVAKNTLMRRAVDGDENWQSLGEFLKDSSAFLFLKDDLNGPIKAYQDFQKATNKSELRGGVLEGKALTFEQVKAIGDLPSKEQLMAQIAGALNAVVTKIAVGIKEVPSGLARGLQAYADKDGSSSDEDQAA